MCVGISQIGSGEDTVHAPVVVDSVYRPDKEKFQTVEQNKEHKKKKPPHPGRSGARFLLESFVCLTFELELCRCRLSPLIDK